MAVKLWEPMTIAQVLDVIEDVRSWPALDPRDSFDLNIRKAQTELAKRRRLRAQYPDIPPEHRRAMDFACRYQSDQISDQRRQKAIAAFNLNQMEFEKWHQ